MPISRYEDREIRLNDHERYKKFFKDRNINSIAQYTTPSLRDFSQEEISSLTVLSHLWTTGSRFYKLAQEFYGHSELWWVIAWFNKTPTESHLKLGDTIYIPTPLDRVLGYLEDE